MPKTKKSFKKGDLIVVEKSNNSAAMLDGTIVEVVSVQSNGNLRVKQTVESANGYIQQYTLYVTGNADVFYHADRKKRAEYLKEKIEKMKLEIARFEEMVKNVEEFETEEDFLAHQIQEILKVKDDRTAIATIVKTLQDKNYI